jgi:exosortase A
MKRDLQLELDPIIGHPAGQHRGQWRHALLLTLLLLIWALAWYASTGKSMVDIWERSGTFTHGYAVPIIVVWLIWRKLDELAMIAPRPAWSMLPLIALAGLAWLIGEVAAVNALSQFALTALLVLAVICVLGTAVARKLAFPLAFLFFAVPVGEFFLPYLMTWTADFTVAALRLSGVPVYREGQQLVIPSGVWAVVEACSGLRYLIASLMVGTLFAYLMYRSLARRLLFVALAIAVPIVANWVRAYMIVMIGHLSNNKLAVGVDHLIYGWVFFGVVIGCLFWVGSRWREDHMPAPVRPIASTRQPTPVAPRQLWAAAACVLVLSVVWKWGYFAVERSDQAARPLLPPPGPLAEWSPENGRITSWRPQFVNPSAELQGTFSDGGQRVGLVLSYYRNQDHDSKLVSSDNRLVPSDDSTWLRMRVGTREAEVNGKPVAIRTTNLRGPAGQELVVWQWYWIDGRLTASDYSAKGYTVLSRLQGRGDDSAAIVVYTLKDGVRNPESTLESFVRTAGPGIDAILQQTRAKR